MANGNTVGDGKTNPFTQGGSNVPGNNFLTNPRGSNTGTGTPRRFDNQQAAPQKDYASNSDINEQDAAAGGRVPAANPTTRADADIGVGSAGNGAKPFTLNGGGGATE